MSKPARVAVTQDGETSRQHVTGKERFLAENEIIVSKTDARGIITYINQVFLDISGYTEAEVMGKPHSYIRHPNMPRCVFKLLWDTIASGKEIFAYVVNRCKNGDHYWVLAHVTPCVDAKTGALFGYHSNRRAPKREAVDLLTPVYAELCRIEQSVGGRAGVEASTKKLMEIIESKGMSYPQFIFSL